MSPCPTVTSLLIGIAGMGSPSGIGRRLRLAARGEWYEDAGSASQDRVTQSAWCGPRLIFFRGSPCMLSVPH
jgi:hypothetical protein